MNETESNLDDLSLPPSLREKFGKAYGFAPNVPSNIDESILAEARAMFSRRMWFRRTLQWSAGVAASAAAIFLAIHLSSVTAPPTAPIVQIMPGDIDRNGKVDIIDAYLMARGLDSHRALPSSADFNHDGKTDAADVEAIAAAAVRLPEGAVQ